MLSYIESNILFHQKFLRHAIFDEIQRFRFVLCARQKLSGTQFALIDGKLSDAHERCSLSVAYQWSDYRFWVDSRENEVLKIDHSIRSG